MCLLQNIFFSPKHNIALMDQLRLVVRTMSNVTVRFLFFFFFFLEIMGRCLILLLCVNINYTSSYGQERQDFLLLIDHFSTDM